MNRYPKAHYYSFFIVLVVLNAALTLLLPPNHSAIYYYHLSNLASHLLNFAIVVPTIGSYAAAFYAFLHISKYGFRIGKDRDGQAMNQVAAGLGLIAFGSPFISIVTNLLTYYSRNDLLLTPRFTIVTTYLGIVVPLVSFLIISAGARGLANLAKVRPKYLYEMLAGFVFIVVSAWYVFLLFHNLPTLYHLLSTGHARFYLPNWLVLLTIAVPYIFIWYAGSLAVVNLYTYRAAVKGRLYKQGLGFMVTGLSLVILVLIASEYIVTLAAKFLSFKLLPLLLISYPLILIIFVGYVLVAIGAKKLHSIEEV